MDNDFPQPIAKIHGRCGQPLVASARWAGHILKAMGEIS
jgi:hypothetical protein